MAGPHTSMPFFGIKTPNFTPGFGDVRDYILVCNEASDAQYRGQEIRCMLYMLDVSVSFSVPRIHVESLEGMLQSLTVDNQELHFALLAATRFRLTEGEVGGYLMIAVGMTSLSLITRALAAREHG